jgi:hypothetical protein
MAESASRFGQAVMNSQENLQANVDLFRRALQERMPGKAELAQGTVR